MEANRSELSADDVVVVIMPDGGYRSLGKVYNDIWMREHGFLDDDSTRSADSLLDERRAASVGPGELVSVAANTTLGDAIDRMREHGISQVPVLEDGEIVGSLIEQEILRVLIDDVDARAHLVRDLMGDPFPVFEGSSALQALARHLGGDTPAVLVRREDGGLGILTRSDLIGTLGA